MSGFTADNLQRRVRYHAVTLNGAEQNLWKGEGIKMILGCFYAACFWAVPGVKTSLSKATQLQVDLSKLQQHLQAIAATWTDMYSIACYLQNAPP